MAPTAGYLAAMRNRSDQFAKNILREALSRAASAETEVEVIAAPQKIDLYCMPDPSRAAERANMGLLGRLSAEPSLFEPFHDTPGPQHVRQCLRKQLTWHHELERRARVAVASSSQEQGASTVRCRRVPLPMLVIISPGRPKSVLKAYSCELLSRGVYRSVPGLALRLVVLAELPQTRDTLMLRLLGKGRVLREALTDLKKLPISAWEVSVAMPLLVHFRYGIGQPRTIEDDKMSAEIRAWFEDYKQKLYAEGRAEGRAEGERNALLRQLRARFDIVPAAVIARINVVALEDLERWAERALSVQTLDEVFDEPN